MLFRGGSKTSYPLLALLALSVGFSACRVQEPVEPDPDWPPPGLVVEPVAEQPSDVFVVTPETPYAPVCTVERFLQPPAEISQKLDVLFVLETADELQNEERAGVAGAVDSFIAALPANVDYRMAVTLAHGNRSSHSGKLYQSADGEDRVLDSTVLAQEDIRNALLRKFENPPKDSHSGGGTAGLYATVRALDHGRLTSSRSQGFFREDAALTVVYVTASDDTCVNGTQPPMTLLQLILLAFGIGNPGDCLIKSPAVHDGDGNLLQPAFNHNLTPEFVLQRIRDIQGERRFLVAALDRPDPVSSYRTVAQLSGGIVGDIAGPEYGESMSTIGASSALRLKLFSKFQLAGSDFDVSSLQVTIDGEPAPYSYDPDLRQITPLSPGSADSVIDIRYCEFPPEIPVDPHPLVSASCQAGDFVPKAELRVGLSIDPAEGSINTIVAGLQSIGVNPRVYTDSEVANEVPALEGQTVLIISRKVVLQPVSSDYIEGLQSFIDQGGSILGEYDGAALFFTEFAGSNPIIPRFTPSLGIFEGVVSGGGALLPIESSRLYVTDPDHPIMAGLPANFLNGVRTGFAVTEYDAEWLRPSATFVSTGFQNLVPAGTYPAVLSGRCGPGRVVLFTMNHLQVTSQNPVSQMVTNALNWAIGR